MHKGSWVYIVTEGAMDLGFWTAIYSELWHIVISIMFQLLQNTQDTDIMQDTPSLDGLILHYQSENSPQTKRKVTGLLQAQAYKQKYSLSDTEAVSMVPELMQFPEDD